VRAESLFLCILDPGMSPRSRDSLEVPRGGAANAYGLVYQMLWSVFQAQKQAATCEILAADLGETDRDLRSVTFVVEPPGGGDLISGKTVYQLKSRPSGRSWSFEKVLVEVLPDLYRAALTGLDFEEYRLVTEGKTGPWWKVLKKFFEDLSRRPEPPEGLSTLDDLEPLAAKNVFGGSGTQRKVFDRVVEVIRREVPEAEPLEMTQRRVWRMLSRFKIENVDRKDLEAKVRHEITLRGCLDEDGKRAELVGALLDIAGGSTRKRPGRVDPVSFFRKHGLDGLRVCDHGALLDRSRAYLERCLRTYGYERESAIRHTPVGLQPWQREEEEIGDGQERPHTERPVVIFMGESGQDWELFRLADDLDRAGELVLLFHHQTGSVESDCQWAARLFCQEIWEHPYEHSLSRLTRVLRNAIPEIGQSRITLLIHGVASEDYTDALTRYPWENLGLRLAVSFQGDTRWRPADTDRCHLVHLGVLRDDEVAVQLERAMGPDWVFIPSDVREVLKHPLLVKLYVEGAATRRGWAPTQEYELFETHWSRYLESAPVEVDAVAELASLLPEEKLYPWPISRLRALGLRSVDLKALEESKLLGRVMGGRHFEIWHDRILNWAIAEGLAARLRAGQLGAQEIPEKALACRAPATENAGRWLGYVPLDLLWLLTNPALPQHEAVEAFLDALEARFDRLGGLQGLPTLGPRITPYLIDRLRRHAVEKRSLRYRYRDLLFETDDDSIPERILELLRPGDVPWRLQEIAAEVLARKPAVAALDRLWELRREAEGEDTDGNGAARFGLRQQLEEALRACVRTAGAWLEAAIRRSDPAREPFAALVYLLPWVEEGRDLWFRLKGTIFAKLPEPDERAAAVCIEAFRDIEEVAWLRVRFRHPDDLVAAMALQAYGLLRPGEPLPEEIDATVLDRLVLTRSWWLPWYLLDDPQGMADQVLRRAQESDDPWDAAEVYSSRENEISPEILRLLLADTAKRLRSEIESPTADDREPLWRHFRFLARIGSRDLLAVFYELAGTPFEHDLVALLERRGPGVGNTASPFDDRALAVLEKIGAEGLARMNNFYLEHGQSRWAREDGMKRAVRRSDKETVRLLRRLARGEVDAADGEADFPVEEVRAVETLADLGKWRDVVEGVVRLGLRFSYEFAERFPKRGLTNAALRPALEALEGDEPPPGAILAVGYSRRLDLLPQLHAILRQAKPESDTAQACMLALEALADTSPETEEQGSVVVSPQRSYFQQDR